MHFVSRGTHIITLMSVASLIFFAAPVFSFHIPRGHIQQYPVLKTYYHRSYHRPLAHKNNSPDIPHALIKKGYQYFSGTPKFDTLIKLIYAAHKNGLYTYLKGYLYELEYAVALYEQGHIISGFHQIVCDPQSKKRREIDILLPNACIECKNITWDYVLANQKISDTLKQQIHDQQDIVKVHAKHYKKPLHYIFTSRTTIPHTWKSWFTEKSIEYTEKTTIPNNLPR